MRKTLFAIVGVALLATTSVANAQNERTMTGAAIGAGTGAVVAGPVGAVVGGVAGAVIGGPRISRRGVRTCWVNRYGNRVCRYR